MDPITIGLLLGGGLGVGKGLLDQGRESRDRKVSAETARWSPWTHMSAQPVKSADVLGSGMQGALAGGMFAGANSALLGGGEAAAAAPAATDWESMGVNPDNGVPLNTATPYTGAQTSPYTQGLMNQAAGPQGLPPWYAMRPGA